MSTCMTRSLITANTFTRLRDGVGWWMTRYLVISRKLRRVERSSRRLICLWHWLQKKSSASSLRKLWKQSGRGAGALERRRKKTREEEEEEVVSDGEERGALRSFWRVQRGAWVTFTGELKRVKCEGYSRRDVTDCSVAVVWYLVSVRKERNVFPGLENPQKGHSSA